MPEVVTSRNSFGPLSYSNLAAVGTPRLTSNVIPRFGGDFRFLDSQLREIEIIEKCHSECRKAETLVALGTHPCLHQGEVVAPGGLVITMVSDDAALEDVTLGADGILEQLSPGSIRAVMNVISPATARTMTDLHRQRHCFYVAAPVFGRPDVATAQQI